MGTTFRRVITKMTKWSPGGMTGNHEIRGQGSWERTTTEDSVTRRKHGEFPMEDGTVATNKRHCLGWENLWTSVNFLPAAKQQVISWRRFFLFTLWTSLQAQLLGPLGTGWKTPLFTLSLPWHLLLPLSPGIRVWPDTSSHFPPLNYMAPRSSVCWALLYWRLSGGKNKSCSHLKLKKVQI